MCVRCSGLSLDRPRTGQRVMILCDLAGQAPLCSHLRQPMLQRLVSGKKARTNEGPHNFNLCPRNENSYAASEFDGRVSRFPFPDHFAPPLSMLPLAVHGIARWIKEDERNVAVIHCKVSTFDGREKEAGADEFGGVQAGKGRSGTVAVAYLLSLPGLPTVSSDTTDTSLPPIRTEVPDVPSSIDFKLESVLPSVSRATSHDTELCFPDTSSNSTPPGACNQALHQEGSPSPRSNDGSGTTPERSPTATPVLPPRPPQSASSASSTSRSLARECLESRGVCLEGGSSQCR